MQLSEAKNQNSNDFRMINTFCCCRKNENNESMFERKRMRCCICVMFSVFLCGVVYLGYLCPARVCALSSNAVTPAITHASTFQYTKSAALSKHSTQPIDKQRNKPPHCENHTMHTDSIDSYLHGSVLHQNFSISDLTRDYRFDINNDKDVIVFLHMQKTGGTTFGRHLVKNVQLKKPCVCYRGRKRCDCENRNNHVWLFSRYSTGWRCGLHADWTELTSCVDGMLNKIEDDIRYRRFLYITVLRDPFNRYVSEYKHVRRGATWKSARLQCNGRQASLEEVPFCFDGEEDWSGVTVDEFLDCPYNLANNRQTRMLANLSLSGCYGNSPLTQQQRDCIMLSSAKENLRQMAFFGLTEYQQETQYLFEKSFGLEFIEDFYQYNHTHASEVSISTGQRDRVIHVNRLDIELYQYAKDLFFQRLNSVRGTDRGSSGGAKASDNRRFIRSSHHSRHSDDYEEGDENFTDDDSAYNHRIAKRSKLKRERHSRDSETHRKTKTHWENVLWRA